MICRRDIFAHVVDLEPFAGDGDSTFEAYVAHVGSVKAEFAAMFSQVFTVGLGEFIEAGVSLEFLFADAPAVGIDFLKHLAGGR